MNMKWIEAPVFKTRITSANVKPTEMLLGYLIGPFCALISNAIFGSYLNRYYSDVLVWTDTSRFGNFSALLPILSVICVIIGNLVVGRLMDSTKSSQGKARPYLILSAPLLAVAIITLFVVPKTAAPAMQMVWIAVSYNLYYSVAYPLYYTAHSSLVALSTRNSNDRGLLSTFSNASGVAAVGIGASILVPMLLQHQLLYRGWHQPCCDRMHHRRHCGGSAADCRGPKRPENLDGHPARGGPRAADGRLCPVPGQPRQRHRCHHDLYQQRREHGRPAKLHHQPGLPADRLHCGGGCFLL